VTIFDLTREPTSGRFFYASGRAAKQTEALLNPCSIRNAARPDSTVTVTV